MFAMSIPEQFLNVLPSVAILLDTIRVVSFRANRNYSANVSTGRISNSLILDIVPGQFRLGISLVVPTQHSP
jgi:hypothetical protein